MSLGVSLVVPKLLLCHCVTVSIVCHQGPPAPHMASLGVPKLLLRHCVSIACHRGSPAPHIASLGVPNVSQSVTGGP